jgi:hypothetical protein
LGALVAVREHRLEHPLERVDPVGVVDAEQIRECAVAGRDDETLDDRGRAAAEQPVAQAIGWLVPQAVQAA